MGTLFSRPAFSKVAALCAAAYMVAGVAQAQTPTPTPASRSSGILQAEGIVGDVDKYHRAPLLSVSTQVSSTGVKILADTAILDPVYEKYPVQVSFFINRKLFSSQYRSPELPGPLGVDVPKEFAAPPFNYTVVAMLLHPNRTFTTVIQGAVFGTELTKTYDCTLSLKPAGSDTATDYTADKTAATQSAENSFDLSFSAVDDTGTKEVTVKTTVNLSGDTATATVNATDKDGNVTQLSMSGTAVKTGSSVESFDVATADQAQSLNCSLSQ